MRYFSTIATHKLAFKAYAKFNARTYRHCQSLAKINKGLSVVHVNSTAAGGGVAELLKNQVPLEQSLGLNSCWLVLNEPKEFFFVTKKIHNLLQGQKGFLSEPEKTFYIDRLRRPGLELMAKLSKL